MQRRKKVFLLQQLRRAVTVSHCTLKYVYLSMFHRLCNVLYSESFQSTTIPKELYDWMSFVVVLFISMRWVGVLCGTQLPLNNNTVITRQVIVNNIIKLRYLTASYTTSQVPRLPLEQIRRRVSSMLDPRHVIVTVCRDFPFCGNERRHFMTPDALSYHTLLRFISLDVPADNGVIPFLESHIFPDVLYAPEHCRLYLDTCRNVLTLLCLKRRFLQDIIRNIAQSQI